VRKAEDEADEFFVDANVFPQTLDILLTRAKFGGIKVIVGDWKTFEPTAKTFGVLLQYPNWGGPLRPLLAMNDPGEAPLRGSLLVAPLGEGTYVYTALALFRQLPEGVPGAYRLLANLVSLGAPR
jgi:hypothetical protein